MIECENCGKTLTPKEKSRWRLKLKAELVLSYPYEEDKEAKNQKPIHETLWFCDLQCLRYWLVDQFNKRKI